MHRPRHRHIDGFSHRACQLGRHLGPQCGSVDDRRRGSDRHGRRRNSTALVQQNQAKDSERDDEGENRKDFHDAEGRRGVFAGWLFPDQFGSLETRR
jgi:hypothetical protein